MVPFLYHCCMATGRQVQGFSAADTSDGVEEYEAITCLACAQIHFVNPKTGKVLGNEDE